MTKSREEYIILCTTYVRLMFGQWLYKNKKMYEDLKVWPPEFHKTGAKLFVQLTAGFGRSFTITFQIDDGGGNP